jgi:hypothetical protein
VDVDRRAYESGAIACDDHVDGVSSGSGSQYVVFKIWAAPFDSIAKDVTRHRHYLERLETNSNSVTLGTCVLGSVPSHEVGAMLLASAQHWIRPVRFASQIATASVSYSSRFRKRSASTLTSRRIFTGRLELPYARGSRA